jgi:hypothetical protein
VPDKTGIKRQIAATDGKSFIVDSFIVTRSLLLVHR